MNIVITYLAFGHSFSIIPCICNIFKALLHCNESIYFVRFGKTVKINHFIGATKPWLVNFGNNGEPQIGQ
jgi:hypothetical protein